MKFDPYDSNLLISGGWDKIVSIFDIREQKPVCHISGPYISGDTIDVRGTNVLCGSYRCEDPIEIWDIRMNERLHNLDWNPDHLKNHGFIMSCCFDEFGKNVIAGSSKTDDLKIVGLA